MTRNEIINYLQGSNDRELFGLADRMRARNCGNTVFLRGLVEFSNYCLRNCRYCGLRRDNRSLSRYRMTAGQIMDTVKKIDRAGVKTVVLQSGDDPGFSCEQLCSIVNAIKKGHPAMAVTLSVGERPLADYAAFREAGADRYLLKHETANSRLYSQMHPGQTLKHRRQILELLKKLKFEVGSGFIIGLPGQTEKDIAADIRFLQELKVEMAGVGPFLPQKDTPLSGCVPGSVALTLRTLALIRLSLPQANLPATTALGSLANDGHQSALTGGANVLMPDFTPDAMGAKYVIYDGKKKLTIRRAKELIRRIGRVTG